MEVIKLELMEAVDLRKIVAWNINKSADDLLQWAGPTYNHPLTLNQAEDYFFKEVKQGNSNIFVYKVLLTSNDEIVGTIELREIDKINKIGRVCRFLIGDGNIRGKGIGTQVLKELLRIGFEELNLEKITLGVFDFNYSAIKCYENSGFVKEKLLKNIRQSSTGYWNLWDMGISKEQWLIKN